MVNETKQLHPAPVERIVRCADVLNRATKILEGGPLPESHNEHGEWCPYCALALAKSQLDKETGCGLSFPIVLQELISGFIEHDSDLPLIEAKNAIGTVPQPFTRLETLEAFARASNVELTGGASAPSSDRRERG